MAHDVVGTVNLGAGRSTMVLHSEAGGMIATTGAGGGTSFA